MDYDEINQILELMRVHGLAEFELERDDLHIRLRKADTPVATPSGAGTVVPEDVNRASAAAEAANGGTGESGATIESGKSGESGATIVEAPILGTFYRGSAPDASPFVEIGDVVKPGDVLCIIEAMKLMNDIKSEHAGEVVEIFVENGQPVQYGERLFSIRRA